MKGKDVIAVGKIKILNAIISIETIQVSTRGTKSTVGYVSLSISKGIGPLIVKEEMNYAQKSLQPCLEQHLPFQRLFKVTSFS